MKNFQLTPPSAEDFQTGLCRNGTVILVAVDDASDAPSGFHSAMQSADHNSKTPPLVFRILNLDPSIKDLKVGDLVSISRFAGDPFGFRSKIFKVNTLDIDFVWGEEINQ